MTSAIQRASDSLGQDLTIAVEKSEMSWTEQVNDYLSDAKSDSNPKGISKLRSLRFRQATWLNLINLRNFDCCVVLESGIGVHAITLAKIIKRVILINSSNDTIRLIEARLHYLGISNIKIETIESISNRPPLGKVLFVGSDSREAVTFTDDVIRLNRLVDFQDFAVISGRSSLHTLFKNDSHQTFHITGKIDQPFKFEPAAQKRKKFGWLKYQIFRLSEKINHFPCIQSSVSYQESLFNRLAMHAVSDVGNNQQVSVNFGYFVKPLGVLIEVSAVGGNKMVRVALNQKAENKFRQAKQVLSKIEDDSGQFPQVFTDGLFEGYYYLTETCFTGANLDRRRLADEQFLSDFYFQSADLLNRMQRGSRKNFEISDNIFESQIGFLVDGVGQCFSPERNDEFSDIRLYLKNEFKKYGHPSVLAHGDFSVDNILTEKGRISGLIDWEFAREEGTLLVDLLFLMVSVSKFVDHQTISKAMNNKLLLKAFSKVERMMIAQYCENFDVLPQSLDYYCVLTILEFLYFRLDIPDEVRKDSVYEKNYGMLLAKLHQFVVDKS